MKSDHEKQPAVTEVHEIARMKMSQSVKKFFSSLYRPLVKIRGTLHMNGNELSAWDDTGRFLVVAETNESFPQFRLSSWELRELLLGLKEYKDPDWVFLSDGSLRLEEDENIRNFRSSNPDTLPSPADKLKSMNWSMDFGMSRDRIEKIRRWSQSDKRMFFSADGGKSVITFHIPQKTEYMWNYAEIDLGSTQQRFEAHFDVQYLSKITLGDYTMSVSKEGAMRFTEVNHRNNIKRTFYFSCESYERFHSNRKDNKEFCYPPISSINPSAFYDILRQTRRRNCA